MREKIRELNPIHIPREILRAIEVEIIEAIKRNLYLPLMKYLRVEGGKLDSIRNEAGYEFNSLWKALASGTVTYNRGKFSGRFTAPITRALKNAGAKWNRDGTFSLSESDMPRDLYVAIKSTSGKFDEKINGLDGVLRKIVPEEISESVNLTKSLDAALERVHKDFQKNVSVLRISPKLTEAEKKKIVDEWQRNLRLYIRDFTGEQIGKLRKSVRESTFAGNRYGSLIKTIQDSYGVSVTRAKFLARQETRLLTTKYQEARYLEAGVREYRWRCVAGSEAHPVRPAHKRLDGTIQRWDDPPITTEPGEPVRRNNPGQDFNCRCMAIPIVRFR